MIYSTLTKPSDNMNLSIRELNEMAREYDNELYKEWLNNKDDYKITSVINISKGRIFRKHQKSIKVWA